MDRKELKNRASKLSFYLKFIQADLDYLDDRDIALPLNLLYSLTMNFGDWPEAAKQREHWFGAIKTRKEIPAPTYMKIGDRKVEIKEAFMARLLQKRLKEFLSKILNEKWDVVGLLPKAKIVLSKERLDHVPLGLDMAIDTSSMPRIFQIRHFPVGKGDPGLNIAVFNFATLLNGLPIDSIKKCNECQNYFVNLSRRKKVFCDIKCAWKKHARLTRDQLKKSPLKYNTYKKKQREIMKRKYIKEREAVFGPNIQVKKYQERQIEKKVKS